MIWPFHKRHVNGKAKEALQDAEASLVRAKRDRLRLERKASDSEQVAIDIRRHNVSNNYDEFLARIVRGT